MKQLIFFASVLLVGLISCKQSTPTEDDSQIADTSQQDPSDTLVENSQKPIQIVEKVDTVLMSLDQQTEAYQIVLKEDSMEVANGMIPTASYWIRIKSNEKGAFEYLPEDVGAESLVPIRWLDTQHLLIADLGALDVGGFFLFAVEDPKSLYKLPYEMGSDLMQLQLQEDASISFEKENGEITAYQYP